MNEFIVICPICSNNLAPLDSWCGFCGQLLRDKGSSQSECSSLSHTLKITFTGGSETDIWVCGERPHPYPRDECCSR